MTGLGEAPACPMCGDRTSCTPVAEVHAAEAAKSPGGVPPEDTLGGRLAPPIYPATRRALWISAAFMIWFAMFLTLMFLNFVPQSLDIILNWRLIYWLEWWRALTWATLGFGLAGLLLAVLYIQTPRTRRDSLALWEAAHYCRLDDLVFIPGYPYSAGPETFHWLIREQPQRWLIRAG